MLNKGMKTHIPNTSFEKCPLCGAAKNKWIPLMEAKGGYSPTQNAVFDTEQEAMGISRVSIQMVMCSECTFIFNALFDPGIKLYGENYYNNNNLQGAYEEYLKDTIDWLTANFGPQRSVLEIGCGNDASFLKYLLKHTSMTATGYDPSFKGIVEEKFQNRLTIKKEYISTDTKLDSQYNLVISRHVIEHMENPYDTLNIIDYLATRDGFKGGMIETPDVSWTLKNCFWYEFSWEHCSLFTPYSMRYLFHKASNVNITDIRIVYGQQYFQTIFSKGSGLKKDFDLDYKENLLRLANAYQDTQKVVFDRIKEKLQTLKSKGNVALWGAAGKGNIFLNLFDPYKEYISCVFDNNQKKWYKYIAGTKHCILPPSEIEKYGVQTVVLLTCLYQNEISKQIKSLSQKQIDIVLMEEVCQCTD